MAGSTTGSRSRRVRTRRCRICSNFHRRYHARRRRYRRGDQDPVAVGNVRRGRRSACDSRRSFRTPATRAGSASTRPTSTSRPCVGKTVQSIRFVGNVGLGILADPTRGDRQNDVLTYGVSIARAVRQGLEVVGEINGRLDTRDGDAASRNREPWRDAARRAIHPLDRSCRCRPDLRHDVQRPEHRLHRRADLGLQGFTIP